MKRPGILLALPLFFLASCATTNINLPAVTDTPDGQFQPGKIIWRDLITDTPAESRRFYEELFGWTFESVGTVLNFGSDDTYSLIRNNRRLIGGMVDANQLDREGEISQWIVVMSVEDVDAAAEVFRSGSGAVLTPPTNLSDRGRLAVVADPQGAPLALLQTIDGDPADSPAGNGDFLWDELWTTDSESAASFYQQVAAYDTSSLPEQATPESSYRVLGSDGRPRVGIMNHPFETANPVWVSYLRVEDPAAITARVISLGGEVFVDAHQRPIGGQAALIAGPSGAGIALQTWPLENGEDNSQ